MYTSVITSAEKATIQEDGSLFLDVLFDIKNDDEVVDTKRLGFPIDTTSEEILAEVQKYTANYAAEIELTAAREVENTELAAADATIEEIIGQEVVVEPAEEVAVNE